jgi:hypothetical protein
MNIVLPLIIGICIGAFIGIFIMCLVSAASHRDDWNDDDE